MTLSKEDKIKIDKAAHREALIQVGLYSVPVHKVHKNKKKYNRKTKHKTKQL